MADRSGWSNAADVIRREALHALLARRRGRERLCSPASSRPEQSPLPTLAGFVFVAENVASHDGPLSTVCAQREGVFDNLTWCTRRSAAPFI